MSDRVSPRIPVSRGVAPGVYVGWVQRVAMCGSPAQLVEQIGAGAQLGTMIVCQASPGMSFAGRRSWSDVFQLWQLIAIAAEPRESRVEFLGWAEARNGCERRLRRRKWRKKRGKSGF